MTMNEEVACLITEAESQQRCAFVTTRALRDACERRVVGGPRGADGKISARTQPGGDECGRSSSEEAGDVRKKQHRRIHRNLVRPFPGMYISKTVWSKLAPWEQRLYVARTLTVMHPNWVFVGFVAALAYGLWVHTDLLAEPMIVMTQTHHRNRKQAGLEFVECHNMPTDILMADGVRVPPIEFVIADCIRRYPFVFAKPVLDAALHMGHCSIKEVLMAGEQWRVDNNALLRCGYYAHGELESAAEAFAHAVIIDLNFTEPILQKTFTDPENGKTYRTDFAWPRGDAFCVLEVDGLIKYREEPYLRQRSLAQVVNDQESRSRALQMRCGVMTMRRVKYSQICDFDYMEQMLKSMGVPRDYGPV
ncbi:hypothetical protein [Bifidobacterium choloepi]|uniref:CTP synthase n=1 Tax=Bifidobacterium choloepi TaxID=2614131 RepID=A0A6I5N9A4_9BIFI|nr:hypothetical protein [Bifidobacterium choloepi]NEG70381.1 hypothetical protein [Bifidobacterium choloepi]